MKLQFRRIISKGNFIPEIDGLRFIAIASVVLYHLNGFLLEKDLNNYAADYNFDVFNKILSVGHIGVPLFFVISGFILARPFAQMYLSGGSQINIGKYFLRRLTRLEPPFILVMTILFFGVVYVAKTATFQEGLIRYLAAITYTHNFIYGEGAPRLLNAVAWSLEIEIQFYILMPILAKIFLISNKQKRRAAIIGLALLFLVFDFYETLPFVSIINYLEYFLAGFLLADIYICQEPKANKPKFSALIAIFSLVAIWLLEMNKTAIEGTEIISECLQLIFIFIFYYLAIIRRSIKLLTNSILTNIGGMCYTIYLLHYPLISLFGNKLVGISFSNNSIVNSVAYVLILLLIVGIASAVYFLMIERPCMDKNWHKKIFKRKSKAIS